MPLPLRHPSTLPPTTSPSPSISPPPLTWFSGPWHVTHSTLPLWKKNRNVRITYTPIRDTAPPHIDDLVTYQPLNSPKTKRVSGVDKPVHIPQVEGQGEGDGMASLAYHWRGKGLLAIASSKWEILGWGEEQGTGNAWVVTYFAKTLFTPAGVDFYSRKGRLSAETVEGIMEGLRAMGGDVERLVGEVFEVVMDGDGKE